MKAIRERGEEAIEIAEQIPAVVVTKDSLRTRLLLLAGGIFISLVLLEVVVRFFESRFSPHSWSDRPHFWYLPEDTTDNRDRYIDPEKASDTYRVIVIGDSFTFGASMQFDDTFPKRLERMLNLNEKQRKVEVLNWGVPGYSTAQEATLVKRAIKSYHPDLLVLEITLNDPEREPYRVSHKRQYREGQRELLSPFLQHWKTLKLVTERYHNTRTRRDAIQYYQDLFSNRETWGIFHNSLEDIIAGANEAQVPLLAALFPLFSESLGAGYPYANLHEKVAGEFTGKNATFIDLLPHYQEIPLERLQVSPGVDSHPGEVAHRIAAEQILDVLLDRKLLPDDIRPRNIRTGKERRLTSPFPRSRKTDSPSEVRTDASKLDSQVSEIADSND